MGITNVRYNVRGTDGVFLPLDDLAHAFAYSNGLLVTDTVVFNNVTYVQTLTYTSGLLTGISPWVKQ